MKFRKSLKTDPEEPFTNHNFRKTRLSIVLLSLWENDQRLAFYEPVPSNTTAMVRAIIFKSIQILQFSI